MNRSVYPLFLTFFAASWLSNDWIIRTTGTLLGQSSLELILAVSSLAGISFFVFLKGLTFFQRPVIAAFVIAPMWCSLVLLERYLPGSPVVAALVALLLGELVKWHAYSQVLNRFGPLSAGRVISFGVLSYELGTMTAAFTATIPQNNFLRGLEVLALGAIYLPFYIPHANDDGRVLVTPQTSGSTTNLLPWILLTGVLAGFLKVSSDTGFKYAIRLSGEDSTTLVAKFYLLSGIFTLGLWLMKRQRWLAMKLGNPELSMAGMALVQGIFGVAFLIGSLPFLLPIAALQRSFDKIFYQPTMQLLSSGFAPGPQEQMRRFHGSAFLGLGSFMGLVAFAAYGPLLKPSMLVGGISVLHLIAALGFALVSGILIKKIISVLDQETTASSSLGSARPMAMLALLSPKHFMVHALIWSGRKGGIHTLPPEILQGLTNQGAGETVSSFYATFPRMDEGHQLAIIRLAIFLDRKQDHDFLLNLAQEKIRGCRRARSLAALHLVKTHGRVYRPLLRRARGKKSPFKKVA